jgi:hypothetical protein
MKTCILLTLVLACTATRTPEVDNAFNAPEPATDRAEVDDDQALDKIRNDMKGYDPAGFTAMGNIPGDLDGDNIDKGEVLSDSEYKEVLQDDNQLGWHTSEYTDERLSATSQTTISTKSGVGASTIELFAAAACACVAVAVVVSAIGSRRQANYEQELPMVATL